MQMPAMGHGEVHDTKARVPPGRVAVTLTVNGLENDHRSREFLVAGVDTMMNVTIHNGLERWVNDTLVIRNGTSDLAVTVPDPIAVSVPPGERHHVTFPVHASESGVAFLLAELQGESKGGEPVHDTIHAPVVPPVAMRIVSPVPPPQDEEFRQIRRSHGPSGPQDDLAAVRVQQNDALAVQVRVENLRDAPVPGFTLELTSSRGRTDGMDVDVAPLDARESRLVTFPEWSPRESFGNGHYFEPQRIAFQVDARHTFGDVQETVAAASYRIENGAVARVEPAALPVEVVGDFTMDVYVTRDLQLGTPARVKVNLTNHATRATENAHVVIQLDTPGNAEFTVQGSERWSMDFGRLAPGDTVTRVIEWTPRVTGAWDMSVNFRSDGRGYGTGGHTVRVPAPLAVGFRDVDVTGVTRIGDRVDVTVSVFSSVRIDDAVLRLAPSTGSSWRPFTFDVATGPRFIGVANGMVGAEPTEVQLGTLRPGEVKNATVTIVADGSGSFTLIPYVLANDFAYTSYAVEGGNAGHVGAPFVHLQVAARMPPVGVALAPLTLVLGVVVGAWTLRTRFVR